MALFREVRAVTGMGLRSIPQRLASSSVVVIGIAGVVGVLVSVLGMAMSFSEHVTSTGRADRAIVLRSGSGVARHPASSTRTRRSSSWTSPASHAMPKATRSPLAT